MEKETPSISVATFLKDNESNIPALSSEFNTKGKIKKLKAVASPLILPFVRGYDIPEGNIDDEEIYKNLGNIHDAYADWGFLQIKQYIITLEYIEKMSGPR